MRPAGVFGSEDEITARLLRGESNLPARNSRAASIFVRFCGVRWYVSRLAALTCVGVRSREFPMAFFGRTKFLARLTQRGRRDNATSGPNHRRWMCVFLEKYRSSARRIAEENPPTAELRENLPHWGIWGDIWLSKSNVAKELPRRRRHSHTKVTYRPLL